MGRWGYLPGCGSRWNSSVDSLLGRFGGQGRLLLLHLLYASGQFSILGLLPLYLSSLGLSATGSGLILGMNRVGRIAGTFLVPLSETRLGNFGSLLLAAAGVALAAALLPVSGASTGALAALLLFLGVFGTLFAIALKALLLALGREGKGERLANLEIATQLGILVGTPACGYLAVRAGFAAALWAWAALSLAVLLYATTLRGLTRPTEAPRPSPLRDLLRASPPLRLGAVTLGLGALETSQQLVLPLGLAAAGHDVGEVGVVLGLSTLVVLVGIREVGHQADRRGDRPVAVGGLPPRFAAAVFSPVVRGCYSPAMVL